MPIWKLLLLVTRARRGWSRIPPAQRQKIVKQAQRSVKKHGPTIAKRVGAAVRQARKPR